MKTTSIYASDGTNHLIDGDTQQIAIIGTLSESKSRRLLPDGKAQSLTVVELFFDTSDSDFWYFDAKEGKLIFNYVHERRKAFILKYYRDCTKSPGVKLGVFLNMITSCYSGHMMGFFDD